MSNEDKHSDSKEELRRYLRNAAIGGAVAAVVAIGATTLVGLGSGQDKRILLEAMLPSTRFLCSSVMTATATILSLMLALLSFSGNSDQKLSGGFYGRVQAVSLVDTIVFIAATFLLLSISIPLNKSDDLPSWWYDAMYYFALFCSCVLGGALITIMLMLYATVSGVISLFNPSGESAFLRKSKDDEGESG